MVETVRLSAEHIRNVAEIERRCFSSEPWSERSLELLLGDSAVGFVTVCDGVAVAYVGMMTVLDEGQITNVATLPEYRKRGFASAVLDALIDYAKKNGVSEIFLEVRESNCSAVRLYEKKGFEAVGLRKNFYRAPTEDAVLMKKTLYKET